MLKNWLLSGAAMLAMAVSTAPAFAQTGVSGGQNVSVQDRARPDYDPVGWQWGVIDIKPRLTVGVVSEDNVFFQQNNSRSDIAYTVTPEVTARTNWPRHNIQVTAGLTDKRYDKFDSENRTNEYVSGEGRLDIGGDNTIISDSFITVGASLRNLGEGRNQPDTPGGAAKPGDYTVTEGFASATGVFSRTRLTARVNQREYDYKRVPLIGGGFGDAAERNRKETGFSVRGEYAISPKTAVFVDAGTEKRDYARRPPSVAVNRDNDVQRIMVGVNFDVSSLARGEIAVGQLDQSFDAPGLSGASGLAVDAKLEWYPQEMTTVTVNASRRAEETVVGAAGSYLLTEGSARVDHELLRNVIVTAQAGIGKREFEGINRDDDVATAGIGVRYLVNREVEIGAGWSYERQESSGSARDRDFDASRLALTLTLRR